MSIFKYSEYWYNLNLNFWKLKIFLKQGINDLRFQVLLELLKVHFGAYFILKHF